MKTWIATCLYFGMFGCGPSRVPDFGIFEPYVKGFIMESEVRSAGNIDVSGLSIVFIDNVNQFATGYDLTTVGQCDYGMNTIRVLKPYWDGAADDTKENLIFHEMGHCVLKLEHTSCPNIMCPSMLDPAYYELNRTHLLDDLFYTYKQENHL